jgi:hypothetical protein
MRRRIPPPARHQQGDESNLTDEKIQRLRDIGFIWDFVLRIKKYLVSRVCDDAPPGHTVKSMVDRFTSFRAQLVCGGWV